MIFGAIVAAMLIPGYRTLGGISFDVDTLVYACASVLIGFHISSFAICAKIFAMSVGLLPEDKKFERWFRYITLETGVGFGVAALLAGLILGVYDLWSWSATGFGQLQPSQALRVTLPSATAIILGIEIIFVSFFLSLLGLKRK